MLTKLEGTATNAVRLQERAEAQLKEMQRLWAAASTESTSLKEESSTYSRIAREREAITEVSQLLFGTRPIWH